jgi:hypothetical protein
VVPAFAMYTCGGLASNWRAILFPASTQPLLFDVPLADGHAHVDLHHQGLADEQPGKALVVDDYHIDFTLGADASMPSMTIQAREDTVATDLGSGFVIYDKTGLPLRALEPGKAQPLLPVTPSQAINGHPAWDVPFVKASRGVCGR